MSIKSNDRLEFRKGALALVPESAGKDSGVAFKVYPDGSSAAYDTCSCKDRKQVYCPHRADLDKRKAELEKRGVTDLYQVLRDSVWDKLAVTLADTRKLIQDKVRIESHLYAPDLMGVHVFYGDILLFRYTAHPDRADILLGRLGASKTLKGKLRHKVLSQLEVMTLSDTERFMRKKGMKTRRQAIEDSVWFRICYHLFLEWDFQPPRLQGRIDEESHDFLIESGSSSGTRFAFSVTRTAVAHVLMSLKDCLENEGSFRISDRPLYSVLKMSRTQEGDLLLALWLRFGMPENGGNVYGRSQMIPLTFGDLVYLKDEQCFARIESPDLLLKKFNGGFSRTIARDKIPEHLDSLGDAMWGREGLHIVDGSLKDLKIYKCHDAVFADPKKLEQSWFYMDMSYGFGNSRVSLASLFQAKKEGKRFLPVDNGWVDVRAVDTDSLFSVPGLSLTRESLANTPEMKLTVPDLFRLMAAVNKPLTVEGNGQNPMSRLLAMTPFEPVSEVQGLESRLRDYQTHGVNWLLFLKEQGMSGILCDDMGLGKTHQVMALMAHMKFACNESKPFLVVAPVTVLSHWESKLAAHAPGLRVVIHHGSGRDLNALENCDVVLTSYGVLRRDGFGGFNTGFSLVVFDEAQYLKNAQTKGYKAASSLPADMKLCVTGTPVENNITELKSLMDLAFPGYLGSDEAFEHRYVKPVMQENNKARREELSRLVSPFTLRRLKVTVLDELPEKIEDVMACRLSEDQITLYRQTVADKGREIRNLLDKSDSIPYIHVFAMLSLLKQICNHPALALKAPEKYMDYESGKWELFKEILSESLSSGQKIVIYSQYVAMIDIISAHLDSMGIQGVCLTGKTRNRGELIKRFNEDPGCRVFVGSLLAGGTGIDLVSASVVIHYDRWWNAAKEDQATDRVHRIGQTRGVQVFKLMTLGTLEEKISAIIGKKKNLMDTVVKEDDPNLLKAFTRDQIIDLLAMPDK